MSQPTPSLSAERWLQVQALFSAALDCDLSHRHELLDQHCAGDPALRREVESLLVSHERAGLLDDLSEQNAAPAALRAQLATLDWEGKRVAQYTVLHALGAGSMGRIYKARDERLGRYVALKFLPPHLGSEPDARRRFLLEARAAAALDHPNICTIHEIGATDDGQRFIAMALYEGETLQARLARGPLALPEALTIALQIANGLAQAHKQGVIHRDVKPSNIMLLADGSVKVLDFGIARIDDAPAPQDTAVIGTEAYMSPEQARGDVVGPSTDIWSLGVVIHEMLAGKVPAALNTLLQKALARTPGERHPSMTQMAEELAGILAAGRWSSPPGDHAAVASGERRRAAVLVCVLPDYVSLIEQLAPQELQRLASRLSAIAADIAERHGGLLERAGSEEIVCVFGIPVAHEDDDLRAVRAARELHLKVQDLPVALRMQSGVHSGRIIARRLDAGRRLYDIKGPAVQLATRIAGAAPSGAILVSPDCQRLIAPFVDTAPGESLVLHAGGPATQTYRVLGESGLQTRLEAAERMGLTPYAGRRAELAIIESVFARIHSGEGKLALVVGEAGVGKSRLLHELRTRVMTTGVQVLAGRCRSYGGSSPYLPFIEILKAALDLKADARILTAQEVAARIGALGGSLEHFVPLYLHVLGVSSDEYALPRVHGDHLKSAIPEALAAILMQLAAAEPRVLLLEDWHWSDAGSRETLRRLADSIASRALLVLVTARPDQDSLADLNGTLVRIDLAPLDFDSSSAIMKSVMGVQSLSDMLSRHLYERTGGNPFFLEEVCRALLEQGSVVVRDGKGVASERVGTLRLPDTVQAVIRTRLDALGGQALELLRVASVIGREFNLELLAELSGGREQPTEVLKRLIDTGLIQQISVSPEAGYRFKHVLTQEVTYDSLLEHQRRSLHELVGQAIKRTQTGSRDEQAELLAYHFGRAESWQLAVQYGIRAADRARALSQFAYAFAVLDRVYEWTMCLRESEERADLLAEVLLRQERLCETLGWRGRQQQIVANLLSQLEPRGASERLAQVYLRKGDLATLLKQFDAADRALSTALRICRERQDATLERNAVRSLGLLRWHEGRHAEALANTERALVIDREQKDELALATDLLNHGMILKGMGEYPQALATLEEALAMPSMAEDPATLAYALHNVANIHRALGNVAAGLECLERANEVTRNHLLPIPRSFHLMSIAHVLLQQGQIAECLKKYEEAILLSRRARHADGLVQGLRALGDVLYGLGRNSEALPYLEEAAALFGELKDVTNQVEMRKRCAVLRNTLGIREWEKGNYAQALRHYEQLLSLSRELGDRAHEGLALNSIGVTLARLSRYEEAHTVLEESVERNREAGEKLLEAHALAALGDMWCSVSNVADARRCYEQSLGLRRALGDHVGEAHLLRRLKGVAHA